MPTSKKVCRVRPRSVSPVPEARLGAAPLLYARTTRGMSGADLSPTPTTSPASSTVPAPRLCLQRTSRCDVAERQKRRERPQRREGLVVEGAAEVEIEIHHVEAKAIVATLADLEQA